MPKGIPNKRYTPEFKKMVIETMLAERLALLFRDLFQLLSKEMYRKGSSRDNKRSKSRNDTVPFFRFGVINAKLFCGAVCKFFWRPQTLDNLLLCFSMLHSRRKNFIQVTYNLFFHFAW